MKGHLTSYPARLREGTTSLLTPVLSSFRNLEVPFAGERSSTRPRPSYRDSGSPEAVEPEPEDNTRRDDVDVDDRGFVITIKTLDPNDEESDGKFRLRNPGWFRIRSDYVLDACSHREDNLIPIRLDLDINNEYRLKDVFLWNLNEELITPTEFAVNLVADLNLPQSFIAEIAKDIRKQLSEYAPVATSTLPFAKNIEDEARTAPVIVEIEVHLSRHLVTDKFQWDLCDGTSVEDFVRQTCNDIGLFGEFGVALSCAIREQLMKLKKEVIESPHGLAGLIEINNECAYDEPAGLRVCQETLGLDWVPNIEILTREEIEKRDVERDRIVRRLRRDTSKFSMTGTSTPISNVPRKRGRPAIDRSRAESPDQMSEYDRQRWKCSNCRVSGLDTWEMRGGNQEFCRFCALADGEDDPAFAERYKWRKNLFSTRYSINHMTNTGR